MATGEPRGAQEKATEAGQPATPEEDRQQQSRTQPARSESRGGKGPARAVVQISAAHQLYDRDLLVGLTSWKQSS